MGRCSGSGEPGEYRGNHDHAWGVYIVEDDPSRRDSVSKVVLRCGGIPQLVQNVEPVPPVGPDSNGVFATVGFPASNTSYESTVGVIQALKGLGLTVIAYGDGLDNWPLRLRCVTLLAGATHLLDSERPDFQSELATFLGSAWNAELRRQVEEQTIRAVMLSFGIVGESNAMVSVFRTALRVSALSDLPVLLTGETGTGKECLARAIHLSDAKRKSGPFIPLNCAALSSSLAEAELFGHRRGTFTGADRDRKGLIRAANHGVLFLDEVGELPESLQAKLLRVVQERRVLSLGSEDEVPVDIRVIAATNRDLTEMVQQRRFRGDLLYRLQVAAIHVPPLRERAGDLRPLVEFLLEKHRSLSSGVRLSVHRDFIEALAQAELPGNVRELEDLICQTLITKSTSAPLSLSDLPRKFWKRLSESSEATSLEAHKSPKDQQMSGLDEWSRLLHVNGYNLKRSLQFCERALVSAAVKRTNGSQSQTARLLGITVRSIYNKLHKHQIYTS